MGGGDEGPHGESAACIGATGARSVTPPRLPRAIWTALSTTLAWFGLAVSPLPLISMIGEVYDWSPSIGGVADLWRHNVTQPFVNALDVLTRLFGIPPIPAPALDYLILGSLLASGFMRLASHAEGEREAWPKDIGGQALLMARVPLGLAIVAALWPVLLVLTAAFAVIALRGAPAGSASPFAGWSTGALRREAIMLLLACLPFIAVGCVWLVDYVFG